MLNLLRKTLIAVTLALASLNAANAKNEEMSCVIDKSGYVSLQFIHKIDEQRQQLMAYEVGQESDWNNPYRVRSQCEKIRNEVGLFKGQAFRQNGLVECVTLTENGKVYEYASILRKEFDFELTSEGVSEVISFRAVGWPLDPSFMQVDEYSEAACWWPS